MKKIFKGFAVSFLLLFSTVLFAQNKTITGKITGEKGEAISSASIIVKGTKTGTNTNANGEFTISVPANATTLVVSSVGYDTKQVGIIGDNLEISLNPKSNRLDEVVVNVGYGTQKRSVVTGAISKVTARDLEKIPSGGIGQMLQGTTSGVTVMQNSGQPGSSSTIRVRGVTTFDQSGKGGNDPLWVVDGVVVDNGGIGYLNQSDIESIEVLKDATSSAIYGTRAAKGVVLVTTKKGKTGKLNVTYAGFVGTSAPAKTLKLLNATEYGALINEKSVASGGPIVYPNLSLLGQGTDWQKQIFNTNAHRSNHEVSMSGGSEKATFFFSLGYQNTEGIVTSEISNYERFAGRLNTTFKLGKIFTIAQTLGYSHGKSKGIATNTEFGGPLSSALNLDPVTPVIETDPIKLANPGLYPTTGATAVRDANGNFYGISTSGMQEMSNPLAFVQTKLGQFGWGDDFVGSLSLEANITKEIKFKSQASGKLAYWGGEGFTPTFYLGSGGGQSNAVNNLGVYRNKVINWNLENFITYTKTIQNHNFSILLGQGSYVDNIGSGIGFTYTNLPTNDYRQATLNSLTSASTYNANAYSTDGNPNNNIHKLASLFARLNYNYAEKYLLTGLLRRDGSSRFGENNQYGIFSGASLGWIVSKEGFWKSNNIVNSLKIRGGYGTTGNDAIR